MEIKYKCPDCGWTGFAHEMLADCLFSDDEEYWSSWICPGCRYWFELDEYIIINYQPFGSAKITNNIRVEDIEHYEKYSNWNFNKITVSG